MTNKNRIIEYIREIGQEKFKKYFLFPEEGFSDAELAEKCDLEISQVKEINALVDDIAILDEFYNPSVMNTNNINYYKIASIERDKTGFTICYLSSALNKGCYEIDYEKFEIITSANNLSDIEVKEAKNIFHKLEIINKCKETLHRILIYIIEIQGTYLDSGDDRLIRPLSQKELAINIGVTPSAVCRAIKCRTIVTPQGKEVILKDLFPGPKKFKITILKKIIETEAGLLSDAQIKKILQEQYGINISRRSVTNLRNIIKVPPKNKCRSVRR
ncbi:MAG: hypothetical protein PHF74_01385 [Dehalococcoidales bacterium]|nr:hypothetical protein [Dehalococcoidales bacterium]